MILRWITPLTIAPAIAMIGLSLFKVSAKHAETNWAVALLYAFSSLKNKSSFVKK